MNEKEKKAIEELSKKAVFCNYEERDYPNMICFKKDMLIVLNLIEKLQKEKEELEEINNELEAEKNEAIRRYNFETIPIKKVKDKIEELKQKAINYGIFIDKDESFNIESKISVLKELLGDK